jgi:hypothetical protein
MKEVTVNERGYSLMVDKTSQLCWLKILAAVLNP